eukprot:jgi/Chrzof1/3448/Cz12g25230.t1
MALVTCRPPVKTECLSKPMLLADNTIATVSPHLSTRKTEQRSCQISWHLHFVISYGDSVPALTRPVLQLLLPSQVTTATKRHALLTTSVGKFDPAKEPKCPNRAVFSKKFGYSNAPQPSWSITLVLASTDIGNTFRQANANLHLCF